jgi:hypothetical protein
MNFVTRFSALIKSHTQGGALGTESNSAHWKLVIL